MYPHTVLCTIWIILIFTKNPHSEFSQVKHNKDQNDLMVVVAAVEEVEEEVVEAVSKEEVVEEDEEVEEEVEEALGGVTKGHL
jgi:uncharacterized protein YwgA